MEDAVHDDEPLPLIPRPRHVARQAGTFALDRAVAVTHHGEASQAAWALLHPRLARCGASMRLEDAPARIVFDVLPTSDDLPGDAIDPYELEVAADAIHLRARDRRGFLLAAQTLRQLLPAAAERTGDRATRAHAIPRVHIRDHARFAWRGLHIDVARHHFPLEDLERLVDTMALHKFNRLHWHLTDDQGWRLEIDGWPRLTEVGGRRAESPARGARDRGDGTPYEGWYTQAQARRLVEHAASRGIDVMPEIDLPGHMQAAIAAYPELGHGAPPEVWTRWGISERVLNVEPGTITFLTEVLEQVMDLFPDRFVHLGGDETPITEWEASTSAQALMAAQGLESAREIQGWFLRSVMPRLATRSRRPVLWDEALEFDAPKDTVVMVWQEGTDGRAAAARGHDVVLCPQTHCYFDHYQGDAGSEPEAIGGSTDLRKVLAYEPGDADWTPEERARLLGIQGNLWTEYIHDAAHLEYMAWPRASALAEVAWAPAGARDVADFEARFRKLQKRLKAMDVFFRKLDA